MRDIPMYHDGSRQLQDRFATRKLADRLVEKLARAEFTDGDRAFIESRAFFFLSTADGEGRPDCSYKGGEPGFVRVLANVGVLVFWIILAANFLSREWVSPDWSGKLACVAGVALGTCFWFFVLSLGASRGHGRFSEKTLLRVEHGSGIGLLVIALIHGGWIVWEMTHHHP